MLKKILFAAAVSSLALATGCDDVQRAADIGTCCGCLSESKPDGTAAPDGEAESVDGNCLPASPDDAADETDVGVERAECADPNGPVAPITVVDAACGATVCSSECTALVARGYTFISE